MAFFAPISGWGMSAQNRFRDNHAGFMARAGWSWIWTSRHELMRIIPEMGRSVRPNIYRAQIPKLPFRMEVYIYMSHCLLVFCKNFHFVKCQRILCHFPLKLRVIQVNMLYTTGNQKCKTWTKPFMNNLDISGYRDIEGETTF